MKLNKDNITAFINKYKYILLAAAALLVVTVILIAAIPSDSDSEQSDLEWGEGITEGIPEFSQECASKSGGNGYAAFYYENVTSEQVGEYTSLIERECGISFSSDKYPRSAKYGEKSITIHYNVTEMKMSVTVTVNGIESTGEQQ